MLVGTGHVVPADSKRSIDRLQHRLEPLRQIAFLRNFKLDAATADLCLRAEQALPHCLRCDKKGLGNACCIQAQYRLQTLKLLFVCAHPAIDPAMHTPLMLTPPDDDE